jgi:broad specificity phosphatase PhoE
MKRLYLLRHGETEWNADSRIQGSIDIPLSGEGRKQASQISQFIKKLPCPEKIFCSNLKRATETASIVSNNIGLKNLEENQLLREINCGLWEGMRLEELLKDYQNEYGMWRMDPSFQCPEGESVEDVKKRIMEFFLNKSEELKKIENILIVAHGLFNRAMLSFIMDLPLQQCRYFEQDNCALNVFIWGEVMPHLALWNFTYYCDGEEK